MARSPHMCNKELGVAAPTRVVSPLLPIPILLLVCTLPFPDAIFPEARVLSPTEGFVDTLVPV